MPQHYAILVTSAPHSPTARTALNFAQTALAEGHVIVRVFFMAEGVECGKLGANPKLERGWQALASDHALDLVLCSSSAMQRGLFDQREATRRQTAVTASAAFTISGLGQWLDACERADRVLRFGE